MYTKEEAKKELKKLIDDFEDYIQEMDKLSETSIRTSFVDRLFEILNWEIRNPRETILEPQDKDGRLDYLLKLENKEAFIIEAKKTKVNLDITSSSGIKAGKQAIMYAWSKKCKFAVVTNFKELKVFHGLFRPRRIEKHLMYIECNGYFNLKYTQFLEKFDLLWLLSKQSFLEEELEKHLSKKDIKISKPVDETILADLLHFRAWLSTDIKKLNPYIERLEEGREEKEVIDEAVQHIIDRLIFIRSTENRGLEEEDKLLNLVRDFKNLKLRQRLFFELINIFKEFNGRYNSKLFEPSFIDTKLKISDEVLIKVINGLYFGTDNHTEKYNFKDISVDLLGAIYEQYLGIILKTTDLRAKLKEGIGKRKEMGIYYTPAYIVDYIVRNTIGEVLRDRKMDISKIKVLDPACGSGSFLIKALDYLYEKRKEKEGKEYQSKLDNTSKARTTLKSEIADKNIFGVDLDEKAVEIAQLNILLKIAESKQKLPSLKQNIQWGDSLIDNLDVSNKAFHWESRFKKIMECGGFDVVIGNPPYVDIKGMPPDQVDELFKKYTTSENRINLYSIFVEKAIQLLKNGGYFGFIIPNSILFNSSYIRIRKLLLDKVDIVKIVRLPDNVFEEAKVETIILIFRKRDSTKTKKTRILLYDRDDKINQISEDNSKDKLTLNQNIWKDSNNVFNIYANKEVIKLLKKIEEKTKPLIEVADFSLGITPYDKYKGHSQSQIKNKVYHSDHKINTSFKKLLSGEDIVRYGVFWNGKKWIKYGSWLGAPREQRFFNRPHIVVRQIVSGNPLRIYCGYTEEELYNTQIGFNIIAKKNSIKLKYLLAILNSKLINFYHTGKFLDKSKNLFQKILIQNAKQFPIRIPTENQQETIIKKVNKMLGLQKQFHNIKEQSIQKENIKNQIQQLDYEIDDLVYKLYGITEKEKKIIKENEN